jgi:hypothetical protein
VGHAQLLVMAVVRLAEARARRRRLALRKHQNPRGGCPILRSLHKEIENTIKHKMKISIK